MKSQINYLGILSSRAIANHKGRGKVWNIGPQTEAHLRTLGVHTALEFARKDEEWVKRHFTKPHREIWWKLHGEAVYRPCSFESDVARAC